MTKVSKYAFQELRKGSPTEESILTDHLTYLAAGIPGDNWEKSSLDPSHCDNSASAAIASANFFAKTPSRRNKMVARQGKGLPWSASQSRNKATVGSPSVIGTARKWR